ncbi:MAG: YdiU family protein [Cardiobacteriaceae bacterium]|nr:YdiU family protein [Cardiobacteriaceae bacterium]
MNTLHWQLDHHYQTLPAFFHQPGQTAHFPAPQILLFNDALARELGLLCEGETPDLAALAPILVGNAYPPDAKPIAQAYAGHQFARFTLLGDGRATLLGEQRTPNGQHIDIQLKGNGRTPYSRRGDGRAALAPMLREYLISEAMHALAIPTTRSLAVATTGETIIRDRPQPGAVLTRTAQSHIRIGTFQYAAAWGNKNHLQTLAEHTRARHYSHLEPGDTLALYRAIIARQAELIAAWQSIGFVHGVMNTDNISISGETLDYGPCAYLDRYDPATTFSTIDRHGRYRYEQQPLIGEWNLARLGETLLPLIADNPDKAVKHASDTLAAYMPAFDTAYQRHMSAKLGLAVTDNHAADLTRDLLHLMHTHHADYTHTFLRLTRETQEQDADPLDGTQTLFASHDFRDWHSRWQAQRPDAATMQQTNPPIIPRNHHVEHALQSADNGDLTPFHRLLSALQHPYANTPAHRDYQTLPPNNEPYRTFCGT